MKVAGCLVLLGILASAFTYAEDLPEPLDERGLRRAETYVNERDYRNAVRLLFLLLRRGDRDATRSEARERLERLGVSSQNIFQLEPEVLKPSELEELLGQISNFVAKQRRVEMDIYYAQQLLSSSLTVRTDNEGNIRADYSEKDVLHALKILLDYAFGENENAAHRAQQILETMGVSGKRVELAKQSVTDDRLSPDVVAELLPCAVTVRLKQYYETLKDPRDDDRRASRRTIAREMGTKLFKYIVKEFPDSSVLTRQNDALDYFRDNGGAQDKF
jgi:hypothetical protein